MVPLLYEVLGVVKFIETQSRMVGARYCGELVFNGTEFQFYKIFWRWMVVMAASGIMNVIPLICTFKNYTMVNFMFIYHNKKSGGKECVPRINIKSKV